MLVVLTSCRIAFNNSDQIDLGGGVYLNLPKEIWTGAAAQFDQQVRITRDKQTFVLSAVIDARPDRIEILVTDPLGRRFLLVDWRKGRLPHYQLAESAPLGFRPENLLADIILSLWPEAETMSMIEHGTWTFDQTNHRLLYNQAGALILSLHRGEGIELIQHQFGYRLKIQTRRRT